MAIFGRSSESFTSPYGGGPFVLCPGPYHKGDQADRWDALTSHIFLTKKIIYLVKDPYYPPGGPLRHI